MSLRNHILDHIRYEYPRIIHGGEIERMTMELGFKASNGSRRCRELENKKLIERIKDAKGRVMYRYIPSPQPQNSPTIVEQPKEGQSMLFAPERRFNGYKV